MSMSELEKKIGRFEMCSTKEAAEKLIISWRKRKGFEKKLRYENTGTWIAEERRLKE